MMRGRNSPQQRKEQPARGGLLSTRLISALPYSNTVKDYYLRTKQSNEALRLAFTIAETCATKAATPFVSKYAAIDKFAGKQLEKLDEMYGDDVVAKSVAAVVYPAAYSVGLAQYARDKVMGIANPAIQMSSEWAGVLVDNLLPPDSDETMEEEYKKMRNLQMRSPLSKLRNRANIKSIIRLPKNAYSFSINAFTSGTYTTLGFTEMSMERMWNAMSLLVTSINTVFEEISEHPWTAVNRTDFFKLYQSLLFYGAKSVNNYIAELEHLAVELSEYLQNRNLPHNAKVVGYLANKVHSIERRLVRLGGVIELKESQKVLKSAPETTTPNKPRARVLLNTPRRVVDPDERFPSMLAGENEHPVDEHLKELEETRRPTMMVFSPPLSHAELEKKKAIKKERKKENKKARKEAMEEELRYKPVEQESREEEPVHLDVDEHGYQPVKSHHHSIPVEAARELGKHLLLSRKKVLPTTPANSPAEFNNHTSNNTDATENTVVIEQNNPFSAIGVEEGEVVGGPVREVRETELKQLEDHQKALKHKSLSEMLKVTAKRLENDEGAQRAERHADLPAWEEPKHPAHKVVEHSEPAPKEIPAAENNPFGKLAEVDASVDPLSIGMAGM